MLLAQQIFHPSDRLLKINIHFSLSASSPWTPETKKWSRVHSIQPNSLLLSKKKHQVFHLWNNADSFSELVIMMAGHQG